MRKRKYSQPSGGTGVVKEVSPSPRENSVRQQVLSLDSKKLCNCSENRLNCLTAKEWLKCQLGVWQFSYEGRDIRDKKVHPATFPISLARRVMELFTHKGEIVFDPFVGSGTTLIAASDCERNAVGFDLNKEYVDLCRRRLESNGGLFEPVTKQLPVAEDARNAHRYFKEKSVKLIFTSPPYANLLNRRRKNKSRRTDMRKNEQYLKVEQYSQDPRDLGTLSIDKYSEEIASIFESLLSVLAPRAHCVINVPDMWWENKRITIHVALIEALRSVGYELRNIIIWDRTNIVNKVGIFGWPSNYITMGVTFEYLLDFIPLDR